MPKKTRPLILCLILLVLLFPLMVSASDDDPLIAWQIEQRCVPAPIASPSEWTYPGTILLSGYAGIHGVQADWETPRVVVQFRTDENGDYPLIGGQLSPDGQWYALPMGETWVGSSLNTYWDNRGLEVISTDGSSEMIAFNFSDYPEFFGSDIVAGGYLFVEWRIDTQLVMGELTIYPFENLVEHSEIYTAQLDYQQQIYFSPDMSRLYGNLRSDQAFSEGFIDVETFSLMENQPYIENLSWRRDSAGFIAQERVEADEWNGLSYYDRDGNLIERIFDLGAGRVNFERGVSGRNDLHWSPDNSQFAFVYENYPEPNRLYVVDWNAQTVIDTCLSPSSDVVWSPDGTMLSYLEPARENLKVVVLDTTTWQTYDVARHSGVRVQQLYSQPDVVGWRD